MTKDHCTRFTQYKFDHLKSLIGIGTCDCVRMYFCDLTYPRAALHNMSHAQNPFNLQCERILNYRNLNMIYQKKNSHTFHVL